jgi:sulfite reductase (NADPH) hemoprotein beta-component
MHIVTGNDLETGLVVYLKADGGWTTALREGRVLADEEEAKAILAETESTTRRRVVGPYLIDVACEDGVLRPTRFREAIRAQGPTIASDFTHLSTQRD